MAQMTLVGMEDGGRDRRKDIVIAVVGKLAKTGGKMVAFSLPWKTEMVTIRHMSKNGVVPLSPREAEPAVLEAIRLANEAAGDSPVEITSPAQLYQMWQEERRKVLTAMGLLQAEQAQDPPPESKGNPEDPSAAAGEGA